MSSPVPSPTWNTVRYTATYRNYDGSLRAGTFKATLVARITNPPNENIFPAGLWQQGELNVDSGALDGKSLDIQLPCEDDPDIGEHNWEIVLVISPSGASPDTYHIQPDVAMSGDPDGIDLVTITLPQQLPPPTPIVIKGEPNGYAGLDADGDVVDAQGTKVLPGGGTGGKGIETASIDPGDGHLTFTYTDASSDDVGKVVGDPGDPGISAYQVALNNGFVGTEAEWLLSLEGPQGEPGSDNTVIVGNYEDVVEIPPYGTVIIKATI